MRGWFQRLIDLTSVAPTDGTIKSALGELVHELGFDSYAYLNVQPVATHAVSNYAPAWQGRYFEQGFETIDPVISTARERMIPFSWEAGSPRHAISKRVKRFFAEAGDFGIRSGISIPVRTAFGHFSMLTLASAKPSLSLERDIDTALAVAAVAMLHAKLEQQDVTPTTRTCIDLTAKQRLCLRWSAEGKTMKDIASIEGMSYATVNFHLNNARKALDATSLAQATALATRFKLI